MSDDVKDAPPPFAPAVHGDALWDLDKLPDGMLHNLGAEPVKVETKTELRKLLNERGLRMKDQQESTTGPELAPLPEIEKPIEVAPALTERHARTFRAFSRFLDRYRVQEALWCDLCFEAGRSSGCRLTWGRDRRSLAIHCRCATRSYTCTTDVSYTRADALTSNDETIGSLLGPNGEAVLPTTLIQTDDAKLVQREISALRALRLNNSIRCRECTQDCELKVSDDEVIVNCGCRIRYWTSTRH